MKYLLIVLLMVVFGLNGCNTNAREKYSEVKHISIDWNTLASNESRLSDFVSSYKYVCLETKPECLMGWIDKIMVKDSTIYILESSGSGRLFMFTSEGKFLRKIDRFGKGPGEYIGIRDFEISNDNSKILILTKSDNILVFNQNASFDRMLIIKDLPEPVSLWHVLLTQESLVFNITSRSGASYLSTNLNGKCNSFELIVPGKAYVSAQLSHGFPNSTFVKRICDTIFKITQKGQSAPYLRIDFGENALTIDEWNKATPSKNGWSKEINHPFAQFNQFYEFKDLFILLFAFHTDDKEKGYCLFGSNDGKKVYCGSLSIFNDYFDNALSVPLATFPENDIICTTVYPFLLHEAYSKYHQTGKRKFHVIDSLCSITKIDDNPIIAFYKLNINQ